MTAFPPLPERGTAQLGEVLEALAVIALTIPMVIAVAALAPVLLIGPFLSPAHQRSSCGCSIACGNGAWSSTGGGAGKFPTRR